MTENNKGVSVRSHIIFQDLITLYGYECALAGFMNTVAGTARRNRMPSKNARLA